MNQRAITVIFSLLNNRYDNAYAPLILIVLLLHIITNQHAISSTSRKVVKFPAVVFEKIASYHCVMSIFVV